MPDVRLAVTSKLRILFYEDQSGDVELALRALRRDFDVSATTAQTLDEMLDLAARENFDVILADYQVPGCDGMQVFREMQRHGLRVPFLLVTGALGEERAVECLKHGVADFVLKDNLTRLPSSIRRAI